MDEDNIRPVAAASALLEVQIDKRNRPVPLTKVQAWNLYMSHTLSTWNARTYEFAAVSTLCSFQICNSNISLDSLHRLGLSRYPPCLFRTVSLAKVTVRSPKLKETED